MKRLSEARTKALLNAFDNLDTILGVFCPCGYGPGGSGRNAWVEKTIDDTCGDIIDAEVTLRSAYTRIMANLQVTP